ncbi:threonine-phosphate decarboxylase [Agrobacterium larrymoorei]|uniref:threonine-phosphate decarboxylase CobD n=1 Tax=Agrobacterium larrymoorei TaxID=160699 RepID=UPI0015725A26|nr:threonine-phosphate decarboxylase CobD [Agrobacterium larrymoorei]NTJ43454.1 threonine-phosphate decarboxylase [Agrobacterium larrymoorei]
MSEILPDKAQEPIRHGGDLGRARALYPHAPEPWIDLSTGINPHSYPHSPIPASAFARLPEPSALARLKETAAKAFGAPSAAHVTAAPGTQMMMPLLAQIALTHGAKTAAVLTPAYAEHARTARMAGLTVTEVANFSDLYAFDYAVVINPNNPDGRVIYHANLLDLATHMSTKGGMLVVDEAFIETGYAESVADANTIDGLVVLRSFGKFYGMAGLRLGFAIAHPAIAATLEARLGPWAVSGPALHVAMEALADEDWRDEMRIRLRREAERLDVMLNEAGLYVAGGTSLFRLVHDVRASSVAKHLAEQGIIIRVFEERPDDMRFGLPGTELEWQRLKAALAAL